MPVLQDFFWFEKGLSLDNLAKLEQQAKSLKMEDGTISAQEGQEVVSSYRSSEISWIPKDENFRWLYDIVYSLAIRANDEMWQFYHDPIYKCQEHIQYSEYKAEDNGHYDWHIDIGSEGVTEGRKISIVVLLSDPSEFEGGDLQIMVNKDEQSLPKGKGNVYVFPSYFLHRVTPVTKGLRKSLVFWVSGPAFR